MRSKYNHRRALARENRPGPGALNLGNKNITCSLKNTCDGRGISLFSIKDTEIYANVVRSLKGLG